MFTKLSYNETKSNYITTLEISCDSKMDCQCIGMISSAIRVKEDRAKNRNIKVSYTDTKTENYAINIENTREGLEIFLTGNDEEISALSKCISKILAFYLVNEVKHTYNINGMSYNEFL